MHIQRLNWAMIASITLIALIALGVFFGSKYSQVGHVEELDSQLEDILTRAGTIRSYTAEVATEAEVGDKHIFITGTYRVDSPRRRYSSFSTTSMTVLGSAEMHTFSLGNISIENVVFTKLETESPIIALTMPKTWGWKRFEANAIAKEFTQIAVPGAVLDNLLLLSDAGKYISYQRMIDDSATSTDRHIRFTLSGEQPQEEGTLQALINRIGADGTIDIWIDMNTEKVSIMHFENPTYRSTTTISSYETPDDIIAPATYN